MTPKPLLKIDSEPFISHVIDSVNFEKANFYFLIKEEHLKENNFEDIFKKKILNIKLFLLIKDTEGGACTVLLGVKEMDVNLPLVIKDCDQIMNWSQKIF